MNHKKTDILIIGLGLAGMTAAITAAKSGKKITIITKTESLISGNTPWAQGGVVYKGLTDSPEKLKKDILKAINKAKQENPHKDIQVEVDTLEQLDIVLQSKATSILLDNFKPSDLTAAINKIRTHPNGSNLYIELSGGITAKTLSEFCLDGVNGISMGALTHNIQSKDISLDIK